jgi:hypothetical protein
MAVHKLPKHFSVVSAQKGTVHDEQAHRALETDLRSAGLKAREAECYYTPKDQKNPIREKNFLVEHTGTEGQKALIDALGQKYGQESTLHSSRISNPQKHEGGHKTSTHHNELRFMDGSPSLSGQGHFQGNGHIKGDHTKVGDISFRLHLEKPPEDPRFSEDEDEEDDKKVEKAGEGSHNPEVRSMADSYASKNGLKISHGTHVTVDPVRAGKIAQAYEGMKHEPNHPEVKASYDALKQETAAQFKHLQEHGYKFSRMEPGQTPPYKNSGDMHRDVRENKHLWYHPTDQGFGSEESHHKDHPMLEPTGHEHGGKLVLHNDAFRIVHDVFGHAKEGSSFGPQGEEKAWHEHMQMYSPKAQKALTTETRGQNSYINFGPHAAHNKANPGKTKYAEQKAGLLPKFAHEMTSVKKSLDHAGNEADKQAMIGERLELLRSKLKGEVIPAKDLKEGLDNPETHCPACEEKSESCNCYDGLSAPKTAFDGKKVTIIFKSDWSGEDRDNFKEDLKRRAGVILKKHADSRSIALEKARELVTLAKAKIYSFQSGKQIADLPSGESTPKAEHHIQEVPHGHEDFHRNLAEKLKARFGDDKAMHTRIDHLATHGHDEPYYGGDSANVQWRPKEEKPFNKPHALPAKVNDLKGVLGKRVPTGSGPDPFNWMDVKYGSTKHALIQHKDKPLDIHTRSDLISHDDYMKHLTPGKHKIFMHAMSDNDHHNRLMEPGAPSFKRRMEAAHKLKAAGHDVTIVTDKLEHKDMHPDLQHMNTIGKEHIDSFKTQLNHVKMNDKSMKAISRATGMSTKKDSA